MYELISNFYDHVKKLDLLSLLFERGIDIIETPGSGKVEIFIFLSFKCT